MFANYSDKVMLTKDLSNSSENLQKTDESILASLVRVEAGLEKVSWLNICNVVSKRKLLIKTCTHFS